MVLLFLALCLISLAVLVSGLTILASLGAFRKHREIYILDVYCGKLLLTLLIGAVVVVATPLIVLAMRLLRHH